MTQELYLIEKDAVVPVAGDGCVHVWIEELGVTVSPVAIVIECHLEYLGLSDAM